jgi:hypothetical protein
MTLILTPDVLVPEFRVCGDELGHHVEALSIVENRYRDAVLGKPVVTAAERARLADDDRPDVELAHQTTAIPARRQRRHHDRRPVVALASRGTEGVGLAVHRGVVVLHPPVASATEQHSVGAEEGGADRYSTLRQPLPGLADGDGEHVPRCHTAVRSAAILDRQNAT